MKFNVDLGPLQLRSTGEEVSVWFKDHSLNNSGVFYTDSNSLEMVPRVRKELHKPNEVQVRRGIIPGDYEQLKTKSYQDQY